MAATVTISRTNVVGNQREVQGTIAFDDSYPTGGEAVAAADFGLSEVYDLDVRPNDGYVFQYLDGKVLAFYADYSSSTDGALIEVANADDLAGVTDATFVARGV